MGSLSNHAGVFDIAVSTSMEFTLSLIVSHPGWMLSVYECCCRTAADITSRNTRRDLMQVSESRGASLPNRPNLFSGRRPFIMPKAWSETLIIKELFQALLARLPRDQPELFLFGSQIVL